MQGLSTNEDYTFSPSFLPKVHSLVVMPKTRHSTSTHTNDIRLTFRSIDGSVTGATEAAQLLYLDDLVSGIEEALNINRMDTLWSKGHQ